MKYTLLLCGISLSLLCFQESSFSLSKKIDLEITLPANHHLAAGAPSKITLISKGESASFPITNYQTEIEVPSNEEIEAFGTIYYCNEGLKAICRIFSFKERVFGNKLTLSPQIE